MKYHYISPVFIQKNIGKAALAMTLFFLSAGFTFAQNVTVNPGAGSYATLKDAFDAINAGTHTGAVTVSIVGNTTETATAVLSASGTGSANYTSITISPSGGAARSITGAITAGSPLIDFNGSDNVTINGLNTGGNSLTIANTTASATSGTCTIRYINGATGNTITNAIIQGSFSGSVATNGGNIFYSTDATTANGNDNNTVSNCDIGPAGTNLSTKGVWINGSTTTTAINNSGIVITNNNIFDYFGAAVTSAGVAISGGTTDITISNNKFYQTATRTQTTGAQHNAINISNTSGNNYQIIGNTIGFASSAGTGTYTFVGVSSSSVLIPIFLSVGTTTASSVQGNTIAGIAMSGLLSGTSSSAPFRGVYVSSGLANIGATSAGAPGIGNTFGSLTANGSITFTSSSTSASDVMAMFNFGSSAWVVTNNNIGGFTVANSSTGAANLYGIRFNTSTSVNTTVQNNTIGSTLANSMQSTSTATGTQVAGIFCSTSNVTATGNIIQNLRAAGGTGTTTAGSVVGIVFVSTSVNHTVSQNTIFNLSNSNTTAATVVTGIQYTASTGTNLIERNLIYDLSSASNSLTAEVNGIRIAGGTNNFINNMIRIGAGIDNAIPVNGINEALGTNNIFHNSIYIGGAPTAGSASSFAFNGSQTTNTRSFRNNIFYNARSNNGANGKNYAVKVGGTGVNPTGLTINNNIYFTDGVGAVFGFYNLADVANLAAWQAAIGQDASSTFSNPQFVNPAGAGGAVDLHINTAVASPAEGNGALIASVTNDFDGQTRAGLTPTDIGADAFNGISLDFTAPSIAYTPLSGACGSGNQILSPVTISDASGVPTSGNLVPRIYYRKGAGAYFSSPGTLLSGTSTNGQWSFTIVAADMGGITTGDVISYYVIAQDNASPTPFIASNPSGVVATSVNNVTTPPGTPSNVTVFSNLNGTYTVGASGDFTTLTAAATAYNSGCLTGPVLFSLIDATYPNEPSFPINFNNIPTASATNTLTIKPAAGVSPTITAGATATAVIKLNGADFITIDGSNGNSTNTVCPTSTATRNLTLISSNTSTSNVVIWNGSNASPANGATNNKFINLKIVGQGSLTTLAGILSGSGATAGNIAEAPNSNCLYENNEISKCQYGISIAGASALNTGDIVRLNSIGSGVATDRIGFIGMFFSNSTNLTVQKNTIFDIITTANNPIGVNIASGVVNSVFDANIVRSVQYTGTGGYGGKGFNINTGTATSNLTISNNMVSDMRGDGWSTLLGDAIVGIRVGATGGSTVVTGGVKLYSNTVLLGSGTFSGSTSGTISAALYLSSATSNIDLQNNILGSNLVNSAASAAKTYAINTASPNTNLAVSNYNNYFVSGTQGVLGAINSVDAATLTALQTATAQDANSKNITPVFTSITDPHLVINDPANTSLICGGTQILGNTNDIDCESRKLTATIGADEVPVTIPANITASATTVCSGSSTTLTASGGATYAWSTSQTGASITVSPTVATTYTVTVTDAAGCATSTSIAIAINALPVAGITLSESSGIANNDGIICAGAPVELTASGGVSYVWTTPAGGNPTTPGIVVLPAGTATYTVAVTGSNGCTSTASTTITVNPLPTVSITSSNAALCVNGTRALVGSPAGGTFTVTSGPGTIAAGVLTATGTGTINLSYSFTNGNGCSATATQSIMVNANPTVSITGNASVCFGSTVTLTASGGTSYLWGNGTTGPVVSLTMPGAPSVIEVIVTDANGCSTTAAQGLTPLLPPQFFGAAIAQPTTCVSTDGAISPILFNGNNATYNWTSPNGSGIVQGQATQNALTVGSYTLVVTGSNGCTASNTYDLTGPGNCAVCPTMGALTASPSPVCSGVSNTFSVSGLTNMGNTYGIQFVRSTTSLGTNPYSGGTVIATVANNALGNNGTTAGATATLPVGTYFVYAILTPAPTDPTCRPFASTQLVVNPLPVVSITSSNAALCVGSTRTLSGSPAGGTFTVTSGPGTIAAGVLTATGAGTINLLYSFTDANGCSATATQAITANALPVVSITSSNAGLCVGSTRALTGSPASGTFTVTSGPGTIAAGVLTATDAGTINLSYSFTDANGCSATATQAITANALPVVSITSSNAALCVGATRTLVGSPAGGTFTVTSGPGTIAAGVLTATGAGTINLLYSFTDANGCSATATQAITVNALPVVSITSSNAALCVGGTRTLVGSPAGGTFTVTSGPGTIAADVLTATGAGTINISYSFTNASGCTASATQTITVNANPTAFTVGGGGSVCATDNTGVAITLSGSQSGVNYQLQRGGVNIGAPVAGTGSALAFPTQVSAGAYTVVATNADPSACTATMSGSVSISQVNCTSINDPCTCKNNATTLENGQFGETITVNAPAGQTWTVSAVTGLYSSGSAAPPAPPTPIAVGTALSANGTTYTLTGVHIDAIGYSVTVTNGRGTSLSIGNTCAYPNPSINGLDGTFCRFSPAVTLSGDPGDASVTSQSFTINGVAATVFDPSTRNPGNYTVTYTVNGGTPKANGANDPGCIQSVSKIVTIIATSSNIVCNDNVQLSLDEDCRVVVNADMVLEGSYGCYDDYQVQIFGPGSVNLGNTLTGANIGQTLRVNVRHLPSGNTCWGNIKVEDKLPPVLTCADVWAVCAAQNYDPNYLRNTLGITAAVPVAADNCNLKSLTFIDDAIVDLACNAPKINNREVSAYFVRKWTATDASGNTSTCEQFVYLERRHVWDVRFPADVTVACGANINGGTPYITFNGVNLPLSPSSGVCEFNVAATDQTLPVCDGTYKIIRTWVVYDWCLPTGSGTTPVPYDNPRYYIQVIKVVDETGPVVQCPPAEVVVSTDALKCCAVVDMPDVLVQDNCSRVNDISAMITVRDPLNNNAIVRMETVSGFIGDFPGNNWWTPDTMGFVNKTTCLPVGDHNVQYTISDDCGNLSFCNFTLSVRDYTPPIAVCDEFTVGALDGDDPDDCYLPDGNCKFAGVGYIKAITFDDGSYDNCKGPIKFTVRRMAPYSAFVEGLNKNDGIPPCDNGSGRPTEYERATLEWDSLKIYCGEVGTTQTVILRVYQLNQDGTIAYAEDGEPLYNECMVQIEVQDKVRPLCTPPAHVTVSCENFDPSLWAYGKPTVSDNCCLDESQVYQDQCGLTHTVSYAQFDTTCSKGTITRTFRTFDCHGNSASCTQRVVVTYEEDYYVRFPDDRIVTVCDGTGQYGAPTFFGEDCELLATSFKDDTFTVVPDACFKIERTWKVINWCTYDPNCALTYIPNPNPHVVVNNSTNLPGPVVSDRCNAPTTDPWRSTRVKINPTDATETNYCTFWQRTSACSSGPAKFNGYEYLQIIKIIDGKPPVPQCVKPDTCDLTDNDPLFWNVDYWWDATHASHDLCEMPIDLKLTATDLCSGPNVNFRYLLFLDLDGNGTMETVVSSSQLPPTNTVYYGNALLPNYQGGTARAFDHRNVINPALDWYRFAIQVTRSGANATAAVRFNTQRSPNTFVNPQLPHGKHKIKWIVEDGCGNEVVCEYPFEIKDCKKPTIVCKPLSVNIMQTGMVTLWASDFLEYAFDNCTPADQLKIAVSKDEPAPAAFPRDPVTRLPITQVNFTCADLGPNVIQLWAEDSRGNADYCQVVLLVQDNMGNCVNKATVAGELKTEATQGVEEGNVQLAGTHPAFPPLSLFQVSDQGGKYQFSNAIPLAGNYTVTPEKNDNPLNGVTTLDLALISKHILGIETLNSPYKLIAADANKSGSVTTFDVVELRKLILGIYDDLPNNKSWRFVDKGYVFPNPANPFAAQFPESKTVANILASQMGENFVGVKIGDVNGTAAANNLMQVDDRTSGNFLFDVQDRAVKVGEVFEVTLKAAEQTAGYQFTLNYPGLEVVDVVPGAQMSLDHFAVFAKENALTTSFNGEVKGEFTVKFRAKQSGELRNMLSVSSRITKAEAYGATTEAGERKSVALRFNSANGSTISGVGFELYQNQPNPFVNKTLIGFHLPEAAKATLTVFDEAGKMVHRQEGEFTKGYNHFILEREVVPTTGMLYYKVETATDSATKKMTQTK